MDYVQQVSLREIESAVRLAQGPIALDFYQASCPPCRALEPRLERVAQEYASRVAVYRIDVDRDLPVAERFGVMSLPTVLVLKAGKEVGRLDGLITEADLRAAFDRATRA
ncbi:MAG: thioredoxin family protein [Armatimonadota bacterium]